jgi:DNA-binding response OmpR family regulator
MGSFRVSILANESESIRELSGFLSRKGFVSNIITNINKLDNVDSIDLLLIEVKDAAFIFALENMIKRIKQGNDTRIILLANEDTLQDIENNHFIDDFILYPYLLEELLARINRVVGPNKDQKESNEYLKAGDVNIDLARCEVTVAGKIVDLTFTEYELLKLLVSKKGHVLTREVLLNKIWGYDYIGGDRTVDVHITRLRNKIEDSSNHILETVRNMGYRIKD